MPSVFLRGFCAPRRGRRLNVSVMLVVLAVLLVVLVLSVTRSARRERERMEAEQGRREALARQGGGQGESPFAGMPFGGFFDALLSGPGAWSRSLEYDPETGRWVDVTDRQPTEDREPGEEGERQTAPAPVQRRTT